MKAKLEVEFNPDLMFDEQSLKEDFGGDWNKAMKWLWEQERLGLFDYEDIKFIGVSNG